MPDIPPAENPSFTLRVGTTGTVMPYSYYIGTELAGYDIELARRFAAWIGAKLEFRVFDFSGIIPAGEGGLWVFSEVSLEKRTVGNLRSGI